MVEPERWTPERVKAFWDHWYQQKNRGPTFSEEVGRGVVRYLRRRGFLKRDVLDYGCGAGALAREIVRGGAECWGCDWSAASVQAANDLLDGRRGWRGAGMVDDPNASYFGRLFSLVTCLETVEHVTPKEEGEFFANLRDVTRPGGWIFLTTPNDEDFDASSKVYCPFCDSRFHQYQHVRTFNESTLATTIENHGFKIKTIDTVHFGFYQAPRWPGVMNVNLRYLARVAAGIPGSPASAFYQRMRFKQPQLCALATKI
ncbi:class I SAM-dependent methyltransferase [Nonomuraea basaltis]|uniref:class I SAM-dependent methyltransferase n=1 Tax=Nonomuraea basaltis TaxID=2495887 RepID=UPI00110C4AAA|nr:class I SAM-dependent methyltransferase [Nonomuraea basaltis]TMR97239.1 class I SAM-dependent methyltransferase [Nonomuraea basaltis]